jgi:hydroxymethylpyrimidine pyrophosphatase-like HAD family hydrolase
MSAPVPGGLPALVATDLDGTLLRPDRTVSARTRAALRAVRALGIPVVLVTGRPVRWLGHVYRELGEGYPAVYANGAALYDPHTDTVRDARPLSPASLAVICQRLRQVLPGIGFAVEVDGGRKMRHEAAYPTGAGQERADVTRVGLADLCAEPAVKLLVRGPGRDPDGFAATVAGLTDGLAETTHSSRSDLVELSAPGVTKASGLRIAAAEYGVAAEQVLAFGDMPNDVPMLAWAGRAVAVANAHPAVRAAAAELTGSHAEDGVAAYLECLLDGRAA